MYRPYTLWNIERNLLKYGSMRKLLQLYSRGDDVGLGSWRTKMPCFNTCCLSVRELRITMLLVYILSYLALTGERHGGWPFFDDDLLCLSSKASLIRPT